MNGAELRKLNEEELARREQDLRQETFQLRMQHATDQLGDTSLLRHTRKELARVLTVLTEVKGG